MIKKVGNIVITLLLLIATAGIPITRHYCGSGVMSVSVYSTSKHCCDRNCDKCHDVLKFSKVNDDFEVTSPITTQSLTDFFTLHASSIISLSENLQIPSLPVLIDQRAIYNHGADYSLASLGNFRC